MKITAELLFPVPTVWQNVISIISQNLQKWDLSLDALRAFAFPSVWQSSLFTPLGILLGRIPYIQE
jgi:hypothetical protein